MGTIDLSVVTWTDSIGTIDCMRLYVRVSLIHCMSVQPGQSPNELWMKPPGEVKPISS